MKFKVLLYCTKAKPYLIKNRFSGLPYLAFKELDQDVDYAPQLERIKLNGKIVAECDFKVEKIRKGWGCLNGTRYFRMSEKHYYPDFELEEHSCLSFDEMNNYLKGTLNEMSGYAIHIKNLHIFDEPKELSECHKYNGETLANNNGCLGIGTDWKSLTKAPQNMMRVWLYENGEWVMYILISIRPQWLCKILNGEKTIEIRKKVLKEMIK